MADKDKLQRFLFQKHNIRGEVVHLNESMNQIMMQHAYPAEISQILSKVLAACVLMCATLKYKGQLTIQFQDPDGAITMLVAKCTNELCIRGVATFNQDCLPENVEKQFQQGHLVITIEDLSNGTRYQSIVQLDNHNIAHALELYFKQSEQLDTRIWIASDETQVAGLMLQCMPSKDGEQTLQMEHLNLLTDTVKTNELLSDSFLTLLSKLYHEEELSIYPPQAVTFKCSCSIEKMTNAVLTLGVKEAKDILKTNKFINIVCEYCNNHYDFSQDDITRIFCVH